MKIIKIVRHAACQLEEDISDNWDSCATSDILYHMKIIRIVVILSDSRIQMKRVRIVEFQAFQLEQDISDISDSSAISDIRYQMRIMQIVAIEACQLQEDVSENWDNWAISDIRYQMKIVGPDVSKYEKTYRIIKMVVQYPKMDRIQMKILRIVEFEAFQLEQDISDISDS